MPAFGGPIPGGSAAIQQAMARRGIGLGGQVGSQISPGGSPFGQVGADMAPPPTAGSSAPPSAAPTTSSPPQPKPPTSDESIVIKALTDWLRSRGMANKPQATPSPSSAPTGNVPPAIMPSAAPPMGSSPYLGA